MSYHQIGFWWLDLIDPCIIFSLKVYLILDEFILAGELQETSKKVLFSYATTYLFSTTYVFIFSSQQLRIVRCSDTLNPQPYWTSIACVIPTHPFHQPSPLFLFLFFLSGVCVRKREASELIFFWFCNVKLYVEKFRSFYPSKEVGFINL